MAKLFSEYSPLQKKLIIGFWIIIGVMAIIVIVAVIFHTPERVFVDNKPEEENATKVSHPGLAHA